MRRFVNNSLQNALRPQMIRAQAGSGGWATVEGSRSRLFHSALTSPRPNDEQGTSGKDVPYDENRHDNARKDIEDLAVPQTYPYESLEGDNMGETMRDVPVKNEGNYPYRGSLDEPFWKRDYIERRHEDAAVKKHDEQLLQDLWAKNKKMTEKYWVAKTIASQVIEGPYRIDQGDGDEIAKDLQQVETLADDIEKRLKDIDEKLSKFEKGLHDKPQKSKK